MVKVRSSLKKKLRRKFIVLIILVNALFISYFLIKNMSNISNQTVVKEINIEAIMKGCFGTFSIPLISYSTPHSKRSMYNTIFIEKVRKIVTTCVGKKSMGRVTKV